MSIKLVPLTKWFPIFRSGTHTDSAGNVKSWSEAEIDKIIELNEGGLDHVRAVIGHPKTDSPSYGKTAGLRKIVRDGVAYLYAQLKDVVSEFADAVNAGLYDRVSIAIREDMTMKHIGFLGATPPAVRGLDLVVFESDDDAVVLEFADLPKVERLQVTLKDMLQVFRGLRDFLIEQYDIETADKVVPSYISTWIQDDINALDDPSSPAFSEPQATGGAMNDLERLQQENAQLKDENTKLKGENSQFSSKVEDLSTEVSTLKTGLETQIANTNRAELRRFAEGLVEEGKITPAQVDVAVGLLDNLSASEEYQFSEELKQKPVDAMKALLASYPQQIMFSEIATSGGAAAAGSNHEKAEQKIKEYMEKNTATYSEAFSHVANESPELFQ